MEIITNEFLVWGKKKKKLSPEVEKSRVEGY